LEQRFGSAGHRELARQAVRQSLVVLKNSQDLLPIPKDATRIHLAGRNANNIGNQCGGWTIEWQGAGGEITEGTTILEAVQDTVSEQTVVTYSLNGVGASGSNVALVVIGEKLYAEMVGDRSNLGLELPDIDVVDRLHEQRIPIVVVLIAGRPLILEPIWDKATAIVVAWLPGTEGQGVADVLFGDFSPTGKLPCSWPRNMGQIPINIGDPDYDPLFELGFGLEFDPRN
jgi:beta-glucosidase